MILTIASHTFRESIRKKILHVLIGLGILIMAVLPRISTIDEPTARIKLVLLVFFQVVVLLSIIGVILLSATSIPNEIEDRTIYGILSKPISRLKIVIGKITGFALLSALLLTVLSLLNFVAIQRIASKLPEKYKGIIKARREFKASQFNIQGKLHHAREGIAWIEGGRTGIAVWSFSDLSKDLDTQIPFEVEFNLKIESSKGFTDTVSLVVSIEDSASGRRKTEVIATTIDEPLTVKVDPELIKKNGTVNVSIFPLHRTNYIGVTQDYVKVFSIEKGFATNYAKAIFITFLKFTLIVVVAVMGSTYLSAPVSIVSSLVVFLCGHVLDFIKDFSLLIQRSDVHEHTVPAVFKKPNSFLIYADYLIKKPLEWISVILPDFKKFDTLKFLLKGVNIPFEIIWVSLGYTAIYACICLFISSLLFKKREFF